MTYPSPGGYRPPLRQDMPILPPPECPIGTGLYGEDFEADPGAVYQRLREDYGPVAPVLLPGDVRTWLVVGYQEVTQLLREEARFSHDSRLWRDLDDGHVPKDWPLLPIFGYRENLQFCDGDKHRRLRSALTSSLKRLDLRKIRVHTERAAEHLIGTFSRDGHADLRSQYAGLLPAQVMLSLLGLPEHEAPELAAAARTVIDGAPGAVEANALLNAVMLNLATEKYADPGEDVASWLCQHESRLSIQEVADQLWLTLAAGMETTSDFIVLSMWKLLSDGASRASWAGGRMTVESALNRTLWLDMPVQNVAARWAVRDTELGGVPIAAGDMLVAGLAAAAGQIRPEPRLLDHNRAHLAYSAGPHECPAQREATMIAGTAIEYLRRRLPDMRTAASAGSPACRSSPFLHGLQELPVTFTPSRSAPEPPVPAVSRPQTAPSPPITPAPEPPPGRGARTGSWLRRRRCPR